MGFVVPVVAEEDSVFATGVAVFAATFFAGVFFAGVFFFGVFEFVIECRF